MHIRSPDSDIFILPYYAPNMKVHLLFDTGTGNRRRLIDVTELFKEFTPTYFAALLGLHAFSRCNTTSAFKGIGKVKPLKTTEKKQSTRKSSNASENLGRSPVTSSLPLKSSPALCIVGAQRQRRLTVFSMKCFSQSVVDQGSHWIQRRI